MRDPMRVLRLSSVFEPAPAGALPPPRFDPVGGMQTHTGELTRALDALGVWQTVVTTGPPGGVRCSSFGRHAALVRLGARFPVFRQCYAVPAARVVHRLAARADLVHAHLGEDIAIVPLALSAAWRHRLPLVLTVHSSMRHTLPISGARSAVLRVLGGTLERYGERRAQAVITLTTRLARLLAAHGVPADRLHVIPSGVRRALFHSADGAHLVDVPRPRVLFLGRLHRQKGVADLVRALALVPSAHLVLAGDGPERARLSRLAGVLGLAHRVRFLGFVPHDQVPALLRDVDLLVMPSRYEELGTALVEARHVGVPVVATRVGGIPDVVRDGVDGLLVPPGDIVALAGALQRLVDDPVLADVLASRARRRAASYTWDSLAERVLDVYQRVVREYEPARRGSR
ncbi:glycosyltransferase [Streptoalloteichus hindustanus]|uniref:Glycosyltransferase involved in cell wall bisynthesis n=1 Tax=Streptoalloteichus hindustanus TaxID=2017 RepID=A0A1M4YCF4_STRHI|nr:glycosyltransferase [Streptoalloteichus hindustanus]SHF03226.1 Glycosyltransferase involved in cell wall bisynthesis [Streptoalloteichus hindustanus]